MVIGNLDAISAVARPREANTPLVVDANTVLTGAIATQGLESVTRWGGEIVQDMGLVQLPQLTLSRTLNIGAKAACEPAMKQCLRIAISKAVYHVVIYT